MSSIPRYLVRIENREGFTSKDGIMLLTKARSAVDDLGAVIRIVRVSSSAVEFDVFLPRNDLVDNLTKALSSSIGNIKTLRRLDLEAPARPKDLVLAEAKSLFNEERFWECHEALEQIWRPETGKERELQQGIILLAAAFVHHQRNRPKVCLSVMKRAYSKLKEFGGTYHGIDIDSLKNSIKRILDTEEIEVFKI